MNRIDLAVAEAVLVIFCEPVVATTRIPETLPLAKAVQLTVAVVGVVTTVTLAALATGVRARASKPITPMVRAASKRAAEVFLYVFICRYLTGEHWVMMCGHVLARAHASAALDTSKPITVWVTVRNMGSL